MNLKEIRKNRGITQKEISLKMAMEQTTYSKKENGKSPITDEEWNKLSEILDTSIEDLKKENEILTKYENCTFNEQAIGVQIVSMPKEALDVMIKYNLKLEEENAALKKS
jgi:transcriptional regulator with XRE-family HTH domain